MTILKNEAYGIGLEILISSFSYKCSTVKLSFVKCLMYLVEKFLFNNLIANSVRYPAAVYICRVWLLPSIWIPYFL